MKKTVIILINLILILSGCTFLSPSESDIQTAIAQTLEADISLNVTPIPDVDVSDSLNITEECFPPNIPGISYETISEYLGEKGVYCNPMQRDAVSFSTTCEGKTKDGSALIWVEIYSGNRPEDIYLILSFVDQSQGLPSNELASDVLGYIAAMPYQNSEPIRAQTWVNSNLSKVIVDSSYEPIEFIGEVRFHMSCHMDILNCLAIGFSQSDYDCKNPPTITDSIPSLSTPKIKVINTPTIDLVEFPTATPALAQTPIVLVGSGTSVIVLDKWDGPALIHIKGQPKPSKFFRVKGDGVYASRFGPYDGVKILDLLSGLQTSELEIEAEGDWTIEILPIKPEYLGERLVQIPGRYEGNGDDVVVFPINGSYRAVISGNSAATNFSIWAYGDDPYLDFDLLVNVVDIYDGTIDLPDWIRYLEIEAEGPWSIEISQR